MARQMFRFLLVALLAFTAAPPVAAQAGVGRKQQERIQRKKEKKGAVNVKKEEKRLLKKHLDSQDRATRKRMKRHKRRSEGQGSAGHRDPFLRRLFGTRH